MLHQDTTYLIQRPRCQRGHLTIVKRRKLQWYGHVSRSSGLAKTILQGTVKGEKGEEDKADRGRGEKTTSGNGQLGVRQIPEDSEEQGKMEETGCEIIYDAPTTVAIKA